MSGQRWDCCSRSWGEEDQQVSEELLPLQTGHRAPCRDGCGITVELARSRFVETAFRKKEASNAREIISG